MAPVAGRTTYDIAAVTVSPQTLSTLYGLKGTMRQKDIMTKRILDELIADRGKHETFDTKFLLPFKTLKMLNDQDVCVRAQNAYRKYVPESVRRQAIPLVQYVKGIVLK